MKAMPAMGGVMTFFKPRNFRTQFLTATGLKLAFQVVLGWFDFEVIGTYALQRQQHLMMLFGQASSLTRFGHGFLEKGGENDGTFWMVHDYGLFACFTTIMWSAVELRQKGERCYRINNTLGMNGFKQAPWQSTYHRLFEEVPKKDIDLFFTVNPLRFGQFDQHSDFHAVANGALGLQWLRQFFQTFMSPTEEVRRIAHHFEAKYRITHTPTIAVCYRGTDKHTEVTPTPIHRYFEEVDALLKKNPGSEVLIQTDQKQVRDLFLRRYGKLCKYIEELPVTSGRRVMHQNPSLVGDRELFAKNLYAMCLAVSKAKVIVTHTGNVGLFLSLHALINKNEVIQLR
jgi:hypothetical protein